jgi:uncharacterized protein (TIGR04255 family)
MNKATEVTTEVTYKNTPLIELIAEIRWSVKTIGIAGGLPIVGDSTPAFDLWFRDIAEQFRKSGFHELERLVPHDAPPLVQQPVFRFKKTGTPFPIYQFGHGIFTINAGPPDYISWENFRPQVEQGLNSLIRAMPEQYKVESFSKASLRYIDAFKDDLRDGQSNYEFMRDTLGVSINLPKDLLSHAKDENEISPTFALQIPLAEDNGSVLNFQLATGRLRKSDDTDSIPTDTIMDMTYSMNKVLSVDSDVLLGLLDNAHGVINHWFRTLTKNLHDKMQPVSKE